MARVLVGTADGLHRFDLDSGHVDVEHADSAVTSLAPEGWELWAVLNGSELWHTAGVGWWFHVADLEHLRLNCIADTRAGVVVGTAQAALFRVAGEGLDRVAPFDEIKGRAEWFTPWGGPPDSRSLAEDRDTVYVNVHVGGIARSSDRGASWEPTIDIRADVHQVRTGHGRVYAATAHGLALSADRGDSWTFNAEGLHAEYCRALAVCGESVLMSASVGPRGGDAAVYRARPDGSQVERCTSGLPSSIDGNIDTYCLDALPDGDLAALATEAGGLFISRDAGGTWSQVASGLPRPHCLLTLP
jgi:hypothetical protein